MKPPSGPKKQTQTNPILSAIGGFQRPKSLAKKSGHGPQLSCLPLRLSSLAPAVTRVQAQDEVAGESKMGDSQRNFWSFPASGCRPEKNVDTMNLLVIKSYKFYLNYLLLLSNY